MVQQLPMLQSLLLLALLRSLLVQQHARPSALAPTSKFPPLAVPNQLLAQASCRRSHQLYQQKVMLPHLWPHCSHYPSPSQASSHPRLAQAWQVLPAPVNLPLGLARLFLAPVKLPLVQAKLPWGPVSLPLAPVSLLLALVHFPLAPVNLPLAQARPHLGLVNHHLGPDLVLAPVNLPQLALGPAKRQHQAPCLPHCLDRRLANPHCSAPAQNLLQARQVCCGHFSFCEGGQCKTFAIDCCIVHMFVVECL